MSDASLPNSTKNAQGTRVAKLPGYEFNDWAPLFVLFITGAFWLLLSSLFGWIASTKFHSPAFLADIPWLTYGRVRAAHQNLMLYGFCVPGGLAVALWILMRAGRTGLALRSFANLGALLLNIGIIAGLGAILSGELTGFEGFEFPFYAGAFVFLGYILVGASAVLTARARQVTTMSAPQWFILAAVFWFAWVYSTALLLLLAAPVRGVTQSVIGWWFGANMQLVWLGLIGLGAAFYLLPKALGRELNSRNLALFVFWMLVLFGSWTGVPVTAPVPAWLPALSAAATVLTIVLYIAVFLVLRWTVRDCGGASWKGAAGFATFGITAFLGVGLLSVLPLLLGRGQWVTFTWMNLARWELLVYGFFAVTIFGCIYAAVAEFKEERAGLPRIARAQFWLATLGTVLLALPLAGAGVVQGMKLRNAEVPFVEAIEASLLFLRLGSIGEVLILVANVLLLIYLLKTVFSYCRLRGREALAIARMEVPR